MAKKNSKYRKIRKKSKYQTTEIVSQRHRLGETRNAIAKVYILICICLTDYVPPRGRIRKLRENFEP